MTTIHIPSPTSGGLMLSYKCTAACRHCMYFCSPRWEADWMSEEDLAACLSQLAGRIEPSPWGPQASGVNDGLHFSGGEPFLNFDLLLRGVEIAQELGIPSTFVETNCFWCRNDEETRDRPYETDYVDTSFGPSFVVISGKQEATPLILWYGQNANLLTWIRWFPALGATQARAAARCSKLCRCLGPRQPVPI